MINKILTEYRKANKLTQQQIAEVLDIKRSTYAYYENGKHLPSIGILSKLSRIYNISIDCLLGNADIHGDLLEDESEFYNKDTTDKAEEQYLSSISKTEQEVLLLFRLIRDKDAAMDALKKLSETETL